MQATARRISPASAVFDRGRLQKLRSMAILDTPQEAQFDRLTELATDLLDVPIALVSLVDDERQFFKCSVGLPEPWASQRGTPLSHSFCQHVVDTAEPLVLEDARGHDVLRENLAIQDLGVIAYAGIPLKTSDGYTLGTFCAIDTKPRVWTDRQIEMLVVFAAAAMSAIELHLERDIARTGEIQLEASIEELRNKQAELVAAQRLEAIGQLTAGLAHDFNNLLQVILVAVEMVESQLDKKDPLRPTLEGALDAGQRAARIVRQLLTFADRKGTSDDIVDVVRALEDMKSLLKNALGSDIALDLDVPGDLPHAVFDQTHLEQVLLNLAVNARRAMPDGGTFAISAKKRSEEATSGQGGAGTYIDLVVSDTGVGMPPEVMDRAFEPFFSTGPRSSRSGLGLSTSLGLIERAGGRMSVYSRVGEGTSFTIVLRAAGPEP